MRAKMCLVEEKKMIVEMIGYLGSILVVVSMLMTSVIKLRVINTIGSLIFTCYALLIRSYPTAALNLSLVIINVVNISRLLRRTRHYSIVRVRGDDAYLHYFLDKNGPDIKLFFPDFDKDVFYERAYVICYGGTTAGIFLGCDGGNGSVLVRLDYASPAFRDCSLGKFLYDRLFLNEGVSRLIFENPCESHRPYLLKMGFVEENGSFVKGV